MMKLVLASGNAGKLKELRQALASFARQAVPPKSRPKPKASVEMYHLSALSSSKPSGSDFEGTRTRLPRSE